MTHLKITVTTVNESDFIVYEELDIHHINQSTYNVLYLSDNQTNFYFG